MHHLRDVEHTLDREKLGPTRLLIVDDDASTRALMRDVLKNDESHDYVTVEAGNGREALEALRDGQFDLIISDINMPEMDGISLLEEVRSRDTDLPIIIVSAFGGDIGPRALELGADDCIYLPFRVEEFVFRVAKALKMRELEQVKQQLLDKNRELWGKVITDKLTGLYTRQYFDDVFRTEFDRSMRYRSDLGLIILDIDHFKNINDVYGHLVGDQVLKRLGDIVQDAVRRVDIPARYGGEEFVLVLPATSPPGIELVGDRLRQTVEATAFTYLDGTEEKKLPQVTISLGAVHFPDERYQDARGMLKAADDLLYEAKRAGRNRLITAWR
jgi:two-component system chemotaxis family response regulator WspR